MKESQRPRTFLAYHDGLWRVRVHEAADGTNWVSLEDVCRPFEMDLEESLEWLKADGGRRLRYVGGVPFARY